MVESMTYGYACRDCGRLEMLPENTSPRSPEYKAMRRRAEEHERKTGHGTVGNPSWETLYLYRKDEEPAALPEFVKWHTRQVAMGLGLAPWVECRFHPKHQTGGFGPKQTLCANTDHCEECLIARSKFVEKK